MIELVDLLLVLCVALTILTIHSKDLLISIILSGAEGVVVAAIFYLLLAPDIALVQVSAGVGIATAFFIIGLKKLERYEDK